MKSTGEVMGIARSYPMALHKALTAAGIHVQTPEQCQSMALLATIANKDKEDALPIIKGFAEMGFTVFSTAGTAEYLNGHGLHAQSVRKLSEGRPHIVDEILSSRFQLVINTVSDNQKAELEARRIRREAVEHNIPVITSLDTAGALLMAIKQGRAQHTFITELGSIEANCRKLQVNA
jgi:carbamoyl-phosphate synthase large subunit